MEIQKIYGQLQIIFDNLFLETVAVTPELNANDIDEWDSIMHISVIVSVEGVFNIKFLTGEVEATQNLGELVALIHKHLS